MSTAEAAAALSPLNGYYINLEGRTDRRQAFERDVQRTLPFFSQLRRLPAIKHLNGALGCTLSHCKALKKLQDEQPLAPAPYVAVFEDDFCILNKECLQQFIAAFEQIHTSPDWDVLTLTPRGTTVLASAGMAAHGFRRIVDTQTATGYIVKSHMLPILLANFTAGSQLMLEGQSANVSACDQYWKRLQHPYKFYYYKNIFAGQLPCWSDLEKKHVNYNARFLKQNNF